MANDNEQRVEVEIEPRRTRTVWKIVALIVLILILIGGILIPIKFVPNALTSIANTLSSLFVPTRKVTLSTDPKDVISGQAFTLKWNRNLRTNGSYSLAYECKPGLRLETSVNEPYEVIPCNTTYYFTPQTTSLEMIAVSEASRYADVNLSLGFLENNASADVKLDDIIFTVTNPNLAESIIGEPATTTPPATTTKPVTKPTPKPSTKPKPTTGAISNPNGTADLEVRLIDTGYLNSNGAFVPSTSLFNREQIALKFQIINIGDKNTGTWSFQVDLPSQTDPRYVSPIQQNLGPGDKIEYVLSFRNLTNAVDRLATITADPSNFVVELTKANNIARVRFVESGTGTGTTLPGGKPDLAVRMLGTGVINRSTNVFTQTLTVNSADRVGVRFEVTNTGTAATGGWRFKATLPTTDTTNANYFSDVQPSLQPGEKATFTIGFENIQFQGANVAVIVADQDNSIVELNETNNGASVTITRN
jgi:hypothetical protein